MGSTFLDTDFHKIFNQEKNIINENKDIKVGSNVWIGCRTTVLKGRIISNGVIISSNSLVTGFIQGKFIYGGIPTELLKTNISWER